MGETRTVVYMLMNCFLAAVRPYILLILMGKLIDMVYAGAEYWQLIRQVLYALGVVGLFETGEALINHRYHARMMGMYEAQSYVVDRKCQTMDYEYLEEEQIHDMIFRIDRATGSSLGLIGSFISNWEYVIRASVSIAAAILMVLPLLLSGTKTGEGFINSWMSSIFFLMLIGLLAALNYYLDISAGGKVWSYRDRASKHKNMLFYYMEEIFSSADRQKDLRILGQRELIEERTGEEIEALNFYNRKEAGANMKSAAGKQSVLALSGILVYAFAGARMYAGMISVGSVVSYAAGIMQMMNSMSVLLQRLARLKNLSRYVNDYVAFMDLGKRKREGCIPLEKRRDNKFLVEFDHVSFRYPWTKEYVIRDLNLKFVIGERMAVVGENGSGKTTFIKLLCRLYDVTEGCIRVNSVDIRKYDYKEYCALFAVVFQDFQIFSFPLGENVASGEEVDKMRAETALRKAGFCEKTGNLPQGLGTYVGREFAEEGIHFSGGEKQKIAIARAIYKDAPFVIMDEPTAALDPVAEFQVFAGFDKMVGNKTAIYISHRLASCRFCQDIIVFDKGRVVQRGSHEELKAQEGLYRRLWEAQAEYYAGEDES